jgi:hypothetical protein
MKSIINVLLLVSMVLSVFTIAQEAKKLAGTKERE